MAYHFKLKKSENQQDVYSQVCNKLWEILIVYRPDWK